MQSESGIVPDFDVGEDFQNEPKTYYELKSQPLKNRSVLMSRAVSCVSRAAAVLVLRSRRQAGGRVVGVLVMLWFWGSPRWCCCSWTRVFFLCLSCCMKLCNSWVLSCQHPLQILAGGADRSEYDAVTKRRLVFEPPRCWHTWGGGETVALMYARSL